VNKKMDEFEKQKCASIARMGEDRTLANLTRQWFDLSCRHKYSYNFTWMGRPIIQYPQDILAMQEIIWRVRPELIIETGIAHGGSLAFYASMLELLGDGGRVVGIDIEIRSHNRAEIEQHPMMKRITMIEGSSIDPVVVRQVQGMAEGKQPVLVVLDSNHTHEHVLAELRAYAPLVTAGSYLVVFDTVVEYMSKDFFPDRPWGPGNNPKTAVDAYLKECDRFAVDREMDNKLQFTVAPSGYLRCIKD
jgi:cephalosporin hydroxylase